jgi:hypothetical protein
MDAHLTVAVDAILHLARYAASQDLSAADEILADILAILFG